MRARYLADAVVTVDAAGSVHRPGALDVEDGVIRWVGPLAEAPPGPVEEFRLGGLVMPGLVNTHAHTPMTLVRSAGDGLPLDRWLREAVWPREAALSGDDVHWGMLLGCDELLCAGVTTTCEMYLQGQMVLDAALEAGIRCLLTPGVFDLPGAGLSWEQCLEDARRLHRDYDGRSGLVTVGVGPHSAYLLPTSALVAVGALAAETGGLIQIHLAETREEGQRIEATHGCSAPVLLEKLGLLEQRVLAAHSVWLSEADLDIYVRNDVAVAHCPQSNGKLGSGVARVAEMLARGLRVGLGTDGPASNDNLDLWEELRLAPLLARAVAADPTAIGTADALVLATRGGAEALGLPTGSLEPGRHADFIRLDMEDPVFVPTIDDTELVAHLVWAAGSRLVTDVWVGGRQVVRDRTCTTVDAATVCREAATRARRLARHGRPQHARP
jgi:5-methylthioadenosine/S-adenosylhomocysteine deaminase